MRLTEEEGRLFFDLFFDLAVVANRKRGIVPAFMSLEAFMARPAEERLKVRDAVYAHPECFDELLREGDLSASADAAEIISGWRDHRVSGAFFILRHLKRHTIFLSSDKDAHAYGVLGLANPLEDLAPQLPAMVYATLLPFRGRIVYDGFLVRKGPQLSFGGGMRRMFEDLYRDATARFGVITSLPHVEGEGDESHDDVEAGRLKRLVKSEESRERNWQEIQELRARSQELELVYHQERGKADARRVGRGLRERGVERGWFALYEGMVIASATTRDALRRRVGEILPASKRNHPYLFQLKQKQP